MNTNIDLLLPEHRLLYKQVSKSFTEEAFNVWYRNALKLKEIPKSEWANTELEVMPTEILKSKKSKDVSSAIATARSGVSSLSSSNGTKKAVEALAEALESLSTK